VIVFGPVLSRYRLAAGLTQEELAERAGLSVRAISDLERGVNKSPRAYTTRQLAEALGLSADDRALFEGAARAASVLPRLPDAPPKGNFLGALPAGQLVGREEELRRAHAILDAVAEGAGHLLLLSGESGVGKTRLLQEIMLAARARGFLVLTGRCYSAEQSSLYYPFLDALAALSRLGPESVRTDCQRAWKRIEDLTRTIEADTETAQSGIAAQQQLLGVVSSLLQRVAGVTPLAILLDDLQWADFGSLKLVQHLARTTHGSPVLLAGAFRDASLTDEHPELAQMIKTLSRERVAELLSVRRLSLEETTQLVAVTMAHQEVSEEFASFVYRRTKGVPRLIDQLVRSLGGRLELQEEIGAGSMGRVFRAFDRATERTVAAKLVLARSEIDLDALLRFQQEGAVLARLEHPHIVDIYDTFVEEHASCIMMELLDGQSLGAILQDGPLPLARAKRLAMQVAEALGYAHSQGIVHRDIKPDNIMVLPDHRVKVTDFGIARILAPDTSLQTIATTGMRMGTPLYMAPEQIEGKKIDGRTDIYAFGAMLYHMVTGRPPFASSDALAVAVKHLQEQPLPPSEINPATPDAWDALILKALAKDPADRFQSAAQMEAAIAKLSTDGARVADAESPGGDAAPAPRRSLLRVLTPPLRPGLAQARTRPHRDRATGRALTAAREGLREARPEVEQAREERSGELSALTRPRGWTDLRRRLAANPLALGGGVAAVLILVLILTVVRPFHSSGGASGKLRLVAVWSAQAPGSFKTPDGVAVDSQGNIYVADQLTNHIQKLSPTGQPSAEWGRKGSSPGQFDGPAGVAVDSQGNIYVTDTGNSRIQKLSPTGQPLKRWGQPGSGPGQFSSPLGVALDRQGDIYVADTGNARIQVLSPTGQPLHQWGSQGSDLFQYPAGVAVDRKGNVYVPDGQSDQIEMLSSSGRLLRRWGGQGAKAGAFGAPIGLAVDGKGNVYVADQTNDTVQKFSSNGGFEAIWGTKGSAPGRFQSPQALAVDSRGRIVVADSGNHRVQQLSSTGKPLATWTHTGTGLLFNQPTGIALDAVGNVYVADGAVGGRVSKLTSPGEPAPGWATPSASSGHQYYGVAVGMRGTVYVADQLNGTVLVLSSAGRRLSTWSGPASKPFEAPQGLAFGQGSAYVADSANDRIVKLAPAGRTLAEWGSPGAAEGDFADPSGVAVDSSGNVYAVDRRNNTVQKISAKGEFIARWAGSGSGNGQLSSPSAVVVDAHGHVYVADTGNNRVEEFSSDGGFIRVWGAKGWLAGQFRSPGGIAVDSQGNVYVADTGNNRIQKFAPPGS